MEFRRTAQGDIGAVVALQRACFPPPFPQDLLFSGSHVQAHLSLFAAGQLVCVSSGEVVASCTNMLVSSRAWDSHLPWEQVTGGLSLPNHDPAGTVLFGIDVSVHPDHRRKGIARGLYRCRLGLVDELGLDKYATVSRMPGFQASAVQDPREYLKSVREGSTIDPTLTPLAKLGLRSCGVAENYMDDPESGNCGAVWEWKP